MAEEDRRRWNLRYGRQAASLSWRPAACLLEAEPLLRAVAARAARARAGGERTAEPPARALDVACGYGRNALRLAALGYGVTAVDVSDVALEMLRRAARLRSLSVEAVWADLDDFRPAAAAFEAVLVVRFLERRLWPSLAAALRPGGLLVAETFTVDRRPAPGRPASSAYRLERGELSGAFPGLQTLLYREEDGLATLIARSPGDLSGRPPYAGSEDAGA